MRILDALNFRLRFRSSVTGQFVTRLFALAHPRETQSERIPKETAK